MQWFSLDISDVDTMYATISDIDRFNVRLGDLLVCEGGEGGRCALVRRLDCGEPCIIQNALHRVRPRTKGYGELCRNEYLQYLLHVASSAGWFDVLNEKATISHFTAEKFGAIRHLIPPCVEQTAIVRFLDHVSDRIDRYIGVKEKLITLLEEYKKVVVHEAITGRTDVRTGRPYPAYRPSGTEWLGRIPSHWNVRRAKRVFQPRHEYAQPDDTQLSATQAYGVIAQARYEEKIGRKVTKILRHMNKRRHVEVDDFVISMRSFQGGLERAWESGCIRSSYIVLQPATKVDVGYFSYLFKSAGYIAALQTTANFIRDGQDLNYNNFCGVDLPFPPMSEQKEIAKVLSSNTETTRRSIKRFREEIELLREFRTRLIADVVTGKLDVREAAASLPDESEVQGLAPDSGEQSTVH